MAVAPGSARSGATRLWKSTKPKEIDTTKGELLQVLRSSNNEEEVVKAVTQLEKVGGLTLANYTTVLTALKRIKDWKVRRAAAAAGPEARRYVLLRVRISAV